MPFQIVFQSFLDSLKVIKISSALPTELPGFLVTFILVPVLLVNPIFFTLVSIFNALLAVGTEMEW